MARDRNPTNAIQTAADWYADGLRFACQEDCGGCCTNHDGYAYLYLRGNDLERLAAFVGLSVEEFTARHTDVDDGDLVIKMDAPACPFLEATRCSVYAARPVQCRTFPFWRENLLSRERWHRLARFCPGIDRGGIHSQQEIRRDLALRKE